MPKIKRFGWGVLAVLVIALGLVACGDNTPTPTAASTPRIASPATSGPNLSQAKIINEQSNDSTMQVKVGESLVAAFDPGLSWSFQLEPANAGTLIRSTLSLPQPYQMEFKAQKAGTVTIKAEGACRPEPGKLCNQAIFIYTITVNVN